MNLESEIQKRSGGACELCSAKDALQVYQIPESPQKGLDSSVHICYTCMSQIEDEQSLDANHWRCLNDSMWSEVDAVKVISWRMLNKLKGEGWPQDLLDMMYLEEDVMAWASASSDDNVADDEVVHLDSNGVRLSSGDNVVIIKDLNVKGGGFTAKRGTAVRGISLVFDNPDQIEGRVNGQHIVLLTQYVKKM